ncbi:ABC transporter permease [Macrococcus brunensis]|nr:ABC transporter permease [Macrococcus brunensis]ULG72324.1 ABC transporter permease [Macrococcus brunensis]ULG74584.1 ABC transporter permease [Macrococcus brunensis]
MKQFKAMMKYELIDVKNRKGIFIMSILMPVIFFLIFSSLNEKDASAETQQLIRDYLLSMTTFSLTSFAMFTFPLEMINDKKEGWSKTLFRAPLSPILYYVCKVLKIMVMFMLSIIIVFLVGHFIKGVNMTAFEWMISGLSLLFGGMIYLTFGLLLSQFNDAQRMSTVSNILYLGLAMLGGLWFPVFLFPDWLKQIAYLSPTYNFKNLAAGLFSDSYPYQSILILIVYGLIFTLAALWLRNKSEVMK